ncbi:MAG: hypothetical protein UH850_03770 [Paludibacteraceae bacterium]|nr:hypothetical protein [Paludibacteraceae bacterium]
MPRKASKNWGDGRNTIMLPVRVLKEDKISYIQALVDTRNNEDVSIFVDSMTQLHIEHLRNDIDIFLKSTEEGNIDERKETTLKNVVESSQKSVEKSVDKIIKQIAEKSESDCKRTYYNCWLVSSRCGEKYKEATGMWHHPPRWSR